MNFANAAKNVSNFTRTENNAVALKSTNSALLDLFAAVGAMRTRDAHDIVNKFGLAYQENRLLAIKTMFYARNIRGGLGERETFRTMLAYLGKINPAIVIKNIELIPFFGRWDDLYVLVGTDAEQSMWEFVLRTLKTDLLNMKNNKPVSLCAKWLKSINTSSKDSVALGKRTAKGLGWSEKMYRRILSSLRAYIKLTESKMSANEWKEIDYSGVPSRAMKNYRNAFLKHDEEGFSKFIGKVEKGEAKINSGTLYPYDILMSANLRGGGWYGNRNFTITEDRVLEAQWKALPNYVEGENNVLVMADTSGSMEGQPMATSIGLAIYFAERNKGAYKDLFLTFSESPSFVKLHGIDLKSKVECVPAIVANTNLEIAFDLILRTAIENHVSEEEMPKSLIIISDMQFDGATRGYGDGYQTFHKSMEDKYARAGYKMPTIIYWQVQDRRDSFQVDADKEGVLLVSGQSTSTFKTLLGHIGKTPYEYMLEVLNDPMYEKVVI